MEVSDADRRKEWSTNQSGMTQTVGTDADIIGVPRSVLAAACHIIRNSEHAESETAKAMRKYALSTQASELDVLRGEVERLRKEQAEMAHTFEGASDGVVDIWRNQCAEHEATIAQLRTEKAAAVELLGVFASKAARYDTCDAYEIMDNVELWQCEGNAGMRVDITIGDLRAARAFLSQQKGEG